MIPLHSAVSRKPEVGSKLEHCRMSKTTSMETAPTGSSVVDGVASMTSALLYGFPGRKLCTARGAKHAETL